MQVTSNYKLKKPDGTDVVKIDDLNSNFEIIDIELNKNNSSLKEVANKVDNIKIADGTTSQKGIVQLNNTVTSTSTTQAATANAAKVAYDKALEAFQCASNGKTAIAGVVGDGLNANNTHQDIANHVQWCKNDLANLIASKGVGANAGSGLHDLLSLVGNISIGSLGGYNFVSGSTVSSISGGSHSSWKYSGNAQIFFPSAPKFFHFNIDGQNFYASGMLLINNSLFRLKHEGVTKLNFFEFRGNSVLIDWYETFGGYLGPPTISWCAFL